MNDKCYISPTGGHQFKDIENYNRDDSGFYLQCMHCNQWVMFDVDCESDYYALWYDDNDENEMYGWVE